MRERSLPEISPHTFSSTDNPAKLPGQRAAINRDPVQGEKGPALPRPQVPGTNMVTVTTAGQSHPSRRHSAIASTINKSDY